MEFLSNWENPSVRDALRRRFSLSAVAPAASAGGALPSESAGLADLDMCVSEFGDVQYRLKASDRQPDSLSLSLAVPWEGSDLSNFSTSTSTSASTKSTSSSSGSASGSGGVRRSRSSKGPCPSGASPGPLPPGALESLEEVGLGPPLVAVQGRPEKGYSLSLSIDLSHLPHGEAQREELACRLAGVRGLVMGAPLRTLLHRLKQGTLTPVSAMVETAAAPSLAPEGRLDGAAPADALSAQLNAKLSVSEPLPVATASAGASTGKEERVTRGSGLRVAPVLTPVVHRPGQVFFALARSPQELLVVHPLHLPLSQDHALVRGFLQGLVEAHRTTSGARGGAMRPLLECTVQAPGAPPPEEVRHAPPRLLLANAGFVSFLVRREHVAGDEAAVERVCWAMCAFHETVAGHVKSTRAFLRTRMRRRIDTMAQSLLHNKDTQEDRRAGSSDI